MRTISENFQKILMSEKLKPLMDKIREDTTLDFEIRNERIEIYYRGLELFSIYYPNNKCLFKFNEKLNFKDMDDTDSSIEEILENFIPKGKDKLEKYVDSEEESQQIIIRENNLSTKADQTSYYIADIEYKINIPKLRFDLLAVKSIKDQKDRKTPPKSFAIIELKYGAESAINSGKQSKSDLKNHFADLSEFIKQNKNWKEELKAQIRYSFNLKWTLNVLRRPKQDLCVGENDLDDKPEYIIILANYKANELRTKPEKLINTLKNIKESYSNVFEAFDVKIAVAVFVGYGLYSEYMKPYNDFIAELEK